MRPAPPSTLFPYTTLFRSRRQSLTPPTRLRHPCFPSCCFPSSAFRLPSFAFRPPSSAFRPPSSVFRLPPSVLDRKSTRLNSSHVEISYAVFCLKKKNTQ